MATGKTPFELNFGRHPWKGDLMVQMTIPQVEEIHKGTTEKLGTSNECTRRSSEEDEESI